MLKHQRLFFCLASVLRHMIHLHFFPASSHRIDEAYWDPAPIDTNAAELCTKKWQIPPRFTGPTSGLDQFICETFPFLLYGLLPWNLRKPEIPLEDPQSERWQQQPKSCLGFVPILRSFWFIYPSCEANLPTAPPRCLRPLHLSHLCHWEDDMQEKWIGMWFVRALESHHNNRRCS